MNQTKLTLLQLKNFDNAHINLELEKMLKNIEVENEKTRLHEAYKQIASTHGIYSQAYQAITTEVRNTKYVEEVKFGINKKERYGNNEKLEYLAEQDLVKAFKKESQEVKQKVKVK